MKRIIVVLAGIALAMGVVTPAQAATTPARAAPTDMSFVISSTALAPGVATGAESIEAVTMPGTKGSVFYYSTYIYWGRLYTVGNIRFSWSHQWQIKTYGDTAAKLTALVCNAIPNTIAKSACVAVVTVQWFYLKQWISTALSHKKCVRLRFPLPPLANLVSYYHWEVTCTA